MYETKPYFYGTGRRKNSVARVRVYTGTGKITINDRDIDSYFGLETLKLIVRSPLVLLGLEGKYDVVVRVSGGGVSGQAGAIRHGLSRALLQQSDENRAVLKKVQYSKLMAENSDLAMTYAVKGMIPSNTIGAKALTRLHCYKGAEHAQAAQKPEKIEF